MKYLLAILFCFNIFAAKEAIDKTTTETMVKALELNEALHAAYFTYNAESVEKSATAVISELEKIKNKKLKTNLDKALGHLKKIKKSVKREDNNKFYHLASVYLIRIINKYDLGPKYQPYYCPMVRKKWIQNISKQEKVHNPYDPTMPHCGGRL